MTHPKNSETMHTGVHPPVWIAMHLRAVPALSIEAKILFALGAILGLWAFSIMAFGIPALVWPMKLVVSAMFLCLIWITWDT